MQMVIHALALIFSNSSRQIASTITKITILIIASVW